MTDYFVLLLERSTEISVSTGNEKFKRTLCDLLVLKANQLC